jgi:hypothetical protein
MKMKYYYALEKDMHIDERFMIQLADNMPQEKNDDVVTLYAAPSIEGPGNVIVFVRTNGDPSYVATFDGDGDCLHINDEYDESFLENNLSCEILSMFGFVPDCEMNHYGIEEWLKDKFIDAEINT